MYFAAFLIQTVIISMSGVLAPGPLTAVTIAQAKKSPYAGAVVAVGHGMIEFPLMIALYFGLGSLLEFPFVKQGIGLAGGTVLLFMGYGMARSASSKQNIETGTGGSALASGIVLSAGNPYFLVWWATVGAALLSQAADFGPAGLGIFMALHWLCDLAWLWILSALAHGGGNVFGDRFGKVVFAACGAALFIFGVKYIWGAVIQLTG